MLKNMAESFKNMTSIIDGALRLAVVAAILGGGYWAYTTVTGFMSKPISLPAIDASGIKLPEIKLPEVKLPEIKLPELPSFKEKPKRLDSSGVEIWEFIPEQPIDAAPNPGKPEQRHKPAQKIGERDVQDIQA